jgi:response regulator RpfG family c-di-GMP phosphodiesterase
MLIQDKKNIKTDRIKVLYVDDHVANLQLFQLMLKKRCEVKIAETGQEGLEILKLFKDIDIVVSDLDMPNMNGLEFIQKAKKIKNDIPFFILSSSLKTNEIKEAIKNNLINNFLRKPLRSDEILNEIYKYYVCA